MYKFWGLLAFTIVVFATRNVGISKDVLYLGSCIAFAGFMAGGTK